MEPKRCLQLACDSLGIRDHAGAIEHLERYRQRRRAGWHEPVCLDHELDGFPVPDGGIPGDILARQLRAEAQHVRIGSTSYGE